MNIKYKYVAIISLFILAAYALFTYTNKEETKGPCPYAVIYETQIEGYVQKFKTYGVWDALFNSDEVIQTVEQLKDSLTTYKTHVRDCQHTYCTKDKLETMKKCDEGIRNCQEISDTQDLLDILKNIIAILLVL